MDDLPDSIRSHFEQTSGQQSASLEDANMTANGVWPCLCEQREVRGVHGR